MIRLAMALLVLWIWASVASAENAIEGLYGPEFTFTENGQVSKLAKSQFINHLRYHLLEFQPPAAKFTEDYDIDEPSEPVFRSPNGWWFKVTDNPGVLEIPMKPMTLAEIKRFKHDIQDAIFASAANSGLEVWDYLGGGHINFDIRIFGGKILLARNFVVDFWNHGELAMGILNYDTTNALPLNLYKPITVQAIRKIIERCDRGEFGDGEPAIERFLAELDSVLHHGISVFGDSAQGKHHDLHFGHPGRIEIRSVRAQPNMDVWIHQLELIENRINNHLRPMTEPIPLKFFVNPRHPLNLSKGPEGSAWTPPVNPQRALKSFFRYVSEAKLDWKDHRDYIWPPWQKGELKKFECEHWLEE